MKQPKGFKSLRPDIDAWKLTGNIYGLKQAAKVWYDEISDKLLHIGYQRSSEPCLFWRRVQGKLVLLSVYVDDLLIACSSQSVIGQIVQELEKHYKLKRLGPLSWYLGAHVIQNQGTFVVDQEQYIDVVLKRFHMEGCQ